MLTLDPSGDTASAENPAFRVSLQKIAVACMLPATRGALYLVLAHFPRRYRMDLGDPYIFHRGRIDGH